MGELIQFLERIPPEDAENIRLRGYARHRRRCHYRHIETERKQPADSQDQSSSRENNGRAMKNCSMVDFPDLIERSHGIYELYSPHAREWAFWNGVSGTSCCFYLTISSALSWTMVSTFAGSIAARGNTSRSKDSTLRGFLSGQAEAPHGTGPTSTVVNET